MGAVLAKAPSANRLAPIPPQAPSEGGPGLFSIHYSTCNVPLQHLLQYSYPAPFLLVLCRAKRPPPTAWPPSPPQAPSEEGPGLPGGTLGARQGARGKGPPVHRQMGPAAAQSLGAREAGAGAGAGAELAKGGSSSGRCGCEC